MTETEKDERALTEKALNKLGEWGENPNAAGGENIALAMVRQGAATPVGAFSAAGDCTPFTPAGKRGILHGQPVASTGAPIAYFIDFSGVPLVVNQIPFTFSVDLNTGKVTLAGAFSGLSPMLEFHLEYQREFDGAGGENILFHSTKSSDDAGYVIAFELVGAS
jgi:hypothetical protein